jgi:hypothetical protein
MQDLLDQIDVASQHPNLYFLALVGALMVPDIGGAIGADDGRASGARYEAWFDAWAANAFPAAGAFEHQVPTLTAKRCYWFRCALLHQGATAHPDADIDRILFIEGGGMFHLNMFGAILNLDVRAFCTSMTAAARNWIAASQGSQPFDTNFAQTMRRHVGGWPPVVVGPTVIT